MNEKAKFTAMEQATKSDFDLVLDFHTREEAGQAGRVLEWLRSMDGDSPYQVTRLEHCLQTATRAERDQADEELVVCALLHDIGDVLAPANHSQAAAALLAPYVSQENHWIVKHHGLFQGYYWFHHYDLDRDARDKYREHEYYEACAEFCAKWDQPSFDPDYDTLPLEFFEPLVRELFAKKPASFF